MSPFGDSSGGMRDARIDHELLEKLLEGRIPPEAAPHRLAEVARALQVLRAPAGRVELSRMPETLGNAAQALHGSVASLASHGRTSMLKSILAKLSAAKLAAIVTAAVVVGAGSAAATGALPSSVQRPLSDALSHVGISIPKPSSNSNVKASAKGSSSVGASSASKKASTNGAKHRSGVATAALKLKGKEHDVLGLCMAYEAQQASGHGSLSAGSMKELSSFAASSKTSVSALCKEIAALRPSAEHRSSAAQQGKDHGASGKAHAGAGEQHGQGQHGQGQHGQGGSGAASGSGTSHGAASGSTGSGSGQTGLGSGSGQTGLGGSPSGVPGASHFPASSTTGSQGQDGLSAQGTYQGSDSSSGSLWTPGANGHLSARGHSEASFGATQ